jgi:hypothetical protein
VPVIPALQRLKQEGSKFEASLGYIVRPCLKEKKKKKTPVYWSKIDIYKYLLCGTF